MIIDGRAIAATVVAKTATAVSLLQNPPVLTIITCTPNFETQKFLNLKEHRAQQAGIVTKRIELDDTVTLAAVAAVVAQATTDSDGVVIQFPFPHLATNDLISLIPVTHDVDVMSYDGSSSALLPPVVGAIDEMSRVHDIAWTGKQVAVVGKGRLVGAPAIIYAQSKGAVVTVITKDSYNQSSLAEADIIILGAGVPNLIRPDMVKDGVIVFDAGTSEEGGVLVGDADPQVAAKARLFTPVPGGVGPLTVAILLKNVLYLAQHHRK